MNTKGIMSYFYAAKRVLVTVIIIALSSTAAVAASAAAPVIKMPVITKPVIKMPAINTPVIKIPATNKPVIKMPAIKIPAIEKPVIKKPATKKPATKKPATKKPAKKKPATKKPAKKKPATKKPATKKPATKKPATKKPATKKIERSFEHAQSPKSFETEIGLNGLNPNVVDPNSEESSELTIKEIAMNMNPDSNTGRPKAATVNPVDHDAQNVPIGNEILDLRDQYDLSAEDLIANDLILDEMNIDELLNDIEGHEQLINEIIQGGTHNGDQDTTENNGGGGDDDANDGDNDYSNNGNTNPGSEANWTLDEFKDWYYEGDIPPAGGDETPGGDDTPDSETSDNEDEDGSGDGIMSTGNEDGSPPWVNHLDDITGQEDIIPEVSTIEIPLDEFTNYLQKSGQTINRSPEFLTKDGVINHDHTSVTMNSAFADNGEFIIEAIPSVRETTRAEGLSIIPHIQAKNFSELIPTITIDTIQDI